MQFGANSFIWVSPFKTESVDLFPKVKTLGFDMVEIAFEDPQAISLREVKQALEANQISVTVCGAFGPDRDLAHDDPAVRENAFEYIKALIQAAEYLGSKVVCGPMYSATGKARLVSPEQRAMERERAVQGVRSAADLAAARGVKLALEPLNRFETDMINTVAQGLEFIQQVGRENVGLHLDTFHMHLEEKNSPAAIRQAGERVFHFHACENDRGVPGTGQVNWTGIAQALKDIHYDQAVVIESFTPEIKEIAGAVCIWREIAPSQDAIAGQGLKFLKTLMV